MNIFDPAAAMALLAVVSLVAVIGLALVVALAAHEHAARRPVRPARQRVTRYSPKLAGSH